MNIVEINHAPVARREQSHQAVTRREAEVLDLAHLTYRQVGEALGIAEETVRSHMKTARLKLGAESARAAVAIWNTRRAA